jgi:hypothetical protein
MRVADHFCNGCHTAVHLKHGANNRGVHWYHALINYKPDIYIFSVGSHVYNETIWKGILDTVVAAQ